MLESAETKRLNCELHGSDRHQIKEDKYNFWSLFPSISKSSLTRNKNAHVYGKVLGKTGARKSGGKNCCNRKKLRKYSLRAGRLICRETGSDNFDILLAKRGLPGKTRGKCKEPEEN